VLVLLLLIESNSQWIWKVKVIWGQTCYSISWEKFRPVYLPFTDNSNINVVWQMCELFDVSSYLTFNTKLVNLF